MPCSRCKILIKNYKVGNCKFSDIAAFSFHPVKTVTTGEGGMVTTSNKFIFNRIAPEDRGIIRNKTTNKNMVGTIMYSYQDLIID